MTSLKPATSNTSTSLHQPVKILASEESLRDIQPKTIPKCVHECCVKYKVIKALAFKKAGEENGLSTKGSKALGNRNWTFVSYGDYEKQVESTALALLCLGVPARTTVAILAVNCPEWFYTQFGAMRINAVSAGIYTTNSLEAVYYVLETSDASVVVVDDSHQMSKVRAIRSRLPQLRAVVQLNAPFDFAEDDRKEVSNRKK